MEDIIRLSASDEMRVQRIHKEINIFDGLATHFMDRDYIKILKETRINTIHYTVAFTTLNNMQEPL